ncbi:MAG TPA: hypothetical protein VE865_00120 [Bradyrhizobium sp.]|nr:hypothetical protein [Bradyrhizobium sp.]
MAWAFDTLGYAKRLREAGVPNPQAEGHAEAAREFIMTELVTKQDLHAGLDNLRTEIDALRTELRTEVSSLRAAIDTQTLRLTVRLGGIVAAGIGILALVQRLQ